VPQVVTLSGTLADTAEHRHAAVLLRDVVDELHDEDGLAHTSTTEEANLATTSVGSEEVHDLNAGLEGLNVHVLVDEQGWLSVNRGVRLHDHRAGLVDGLADDVHDAPQGPFAHGHQDWVPRVHHGGATNETVGGVHRDCADATVTRVLSNLDDEVPLAIVDRGVRHAKRGVDLGEVTLGKLDIDHRADDLSNASLGEICDFDCSCHRCPLVGSGRPLRRSPWRGVG
jgi:peptide chain release factor 1